MACDRILRDFVFDLFLETVQPLPRKLLERLQRRLLSPGRVCDVTPKINLKRTVQSEQKIVLSGTVKGFPFDGEDIVEILARAVEGFREVDWDECSVKLDLETDHLWTNLSQADRRRFHQYQAPCHGGSLTRAFRSQSVQEFVRSEEGIHERRRRPKKLPRRLKLGGEAQVESIFEGTPGTRPNRVFRPQTDEDYDFNREYEESLGAPILTDEPFFKLAASERRAIVHELNKSKKDVAMWFHYASMDSLALVVEVYRVCEDALRPTVEIVGTLENVPEDVTRAAVAKEIAGVFQHWANAGNFQISLTKLSLEEVDSV